MTEIKQVWWKMMEAKYNTDEAGVRAIMAERQKKSMASPKRKDKPHVGGFNMPGIAKQAGDLGRKTRYAKKT